MTKRIYIKTFGCQMNDYDSERMYRIMEREGWRRVPKADEADVIIINTCSVRDKAEHKAVSEVGAMKRVKRKNSKCITVLAGCVAQQHGEKLLKRAPNLDLVLGTHALSKLPELIQECLDGKRLAQTDWDYDHLFEGSGYPNVNPDGRLSWKGSLASGFISIVHGCDMRCSYCIVPTVRGREISRPMGDILSEARHLADSGIKEITLLGQIVNRYGRDLKLPSAFHELLVEVLKIKAIKKLSFASSHPNYITPDIIKLIGHEARLAAHVHLPVQSGSDRILKSMRRGYTIRKYIETVVRLREARPGLSISSDLIVGYPGESEEDFQGTCDLIKELEFDSLFAFKYSVRPGTPAQNMEETVSPEEKAARLKIIHEISAPIILRKNKALVGKTLEVIVHGFHERDGKYFGRSSCNRVVHFSADNMQIGDTVLAVIDTGLANSLLGSIVTT